MRALLAVSGLGVAGVLLLAGLQSGSTADAESAERGSLGKATLAGGFFWCVEADFDKVPGVIETISGYAGGREADPTYKEVSSGRTGHAEVVQVIYDPSKVSYERLLEVFWRSVDPYDASGQFCDRGSQYRSAIFYHNEEQKRLADESIRLLERSGRLSNPIVTKIAPLTKFYRAEEYHQDFHTKSPVRYKSYRYGCRRDHRLEVVWGTGDLEIFEDREEATLKDLRETLTPLQFRVTQEDGTEPPFRNEYWDNHEPGIYVEVVSGEPLFSSLDKFESGTGWPSFSRPLEPGNVKRTRDFKLMMPRTEVRSELGDSHLGHVFPDGPKPTGLRYCINSAALRFVPTSKLEAEGYGQYAEAFERETETAAKR